MTTSSDGTAILSIAAKLTASVDNATAEMRRSREFQERLSNAIYPTYISGIPIPLSEEGAGTLQVPAMLGPTMGRFWDVHRVAAWGFTAGTVTVYDTSPNGDLLLPFSEAGVTTLGKSQLLLRSGQNLCFVASGITGTVTVSMAMTQIDAPMIGDYLL